MHVSRPIHLPESHPVQPRRGIHLVVIYALVMLIAMPGVILLGEREALLPCGGELAAFCAP